MKNSGYDRNEYVLGKRASGYDRGPFAYTKASYMDMDSSPGAAGALYSTVEDMFLWDRALYTDKLLKQDFRELMFTPNRDVPEVKAAGGRAQSRYGYGWQIYTRTHPITKHRTKVINHGGAINGFRAMENRLVDDDAFVIVLCNQGDSFGSGDVWNTVMNLSAELIHVVTDQPFRMPGKARLTQDQRLYAMVKEQGVDTAIEWFKEKGRKAAWGGTTMALAQQLIKDGNVDEGIQFMELEIKLSPGKVWLLRKTAEACLGNGRPKKALEWAENGLALKPKDQKLLGLKSEAEQDLNRGE
jgi:CubicO group peptidase (beta-lactamase class C family)